MAMMNRNVSLEEINVDAFLGIDIFRYQTVYQKVIFFVSVGLSILWNVLGIFVFKISSFVIILVTFIILIICLLFSGNYNEDFTLFNFLKLKITKYSEAYVTKSCEDVEQIKVEMIRIDKEDKDKEKKKATTEEDIKKKQKKIIAGVLVYCVVMLLVIILILASKGEQLHHVIGM